MENETIRILLFFFGIFLAVCLLSPFYAVLYADKIDAAFKKMAGKLKRAFRAA